MDSRLRGNDEGLRAGMATYKGWLWSES